MAYVPPNKRRGEEDHEEKPLHPTSIAEKLDEKLTIGSGASGSRKQTRKTCVGGYNLGYQYTANTISRVLPVALIGDSNNIPSSVELTRYSCESYELKTGYNYFALVNDQVNEATHPPMAKEPWLYIVEKIEKDVLTSFQNVRRVMESDGSGDVGASLVARLGKILFYGGAPPNLDSIRSGLLSGSFMGATKKLFFTTVPDAYIDHVENEIARDGKLGSVIKKEQFMIKIVDNGRPGSILTCKCTRKEDAKLELLKVETDSRRHLIVDLPLFLKPLDLRLMLYTKRKLVSLTDKEKNYISKIIGAAILDPNAKGGLRWPIGKDSIGGRFHVQEFYHLKSKVYNSSIMNVRLRYADRFDLRTSVGEYGCEITSKLTDLKQYLKDEDVGGDAELVETLKESLRFIWDNLLNWDGKVDLE